MVADGWCYAPIYLKQAAVEADPVERMKNVITFAIAGLSNTCVVKKPFNPIVGKYYLLFIFHFTAIYWIFF